MTDSSRSIASIAFSFCFCNFSITADNDSRRDAKSSIVSLSAPMLSIWFSVARCASYVANSIRLSASFCFAMSVLQDLLIALDAKRSSSSRIVNVSVVGAVVGTYRTLGRVRRDVGLLAAHPAVEVRI